MDRRRFLAWLGGTAAGVAIAPTLDLDRLLWVPGEKTIFLPALQPINLDEFAREWLKLVENNLAFTRYINRHYEDRFVREVGETVRVRLPVRFA